MPVLLALWLGCAPLDNADPDGDGFTTGEGDCDPLDPDVHPGVGDCPGDCGSADQPCNPEGQVSIDGANVTVVGEVPGDGVGGRIQAVADLDGDGADELLLMAPSADHAGPDHGSVYLLAPASSTADLAVVGSRFDGGAPFEIQAGGVGDLNGDGLGDLMIGSGWQVRLLLGPVDEHRGATPEGFARIEDLPGVIGDAPVGIGDLDGDGQGFVALVADADAGPAQVGLFKGPFAGAHSWSEAQATIEARDYGGESFGTTAALGDVDGDGLADFAVTEQYADDFVVQGEAFVFLSTPTGIATPRDAEIRLPDWYAFKFVGDPLDETTIRASPHGQVAGAGDADGDGLDDVWVGLPGQVGNVEATGSQFEVGAAMLLTGLTGGADQHAPDPALTIFGSAGDMNLGVSLDSGDVNADGVPDLLLGHNGGGYLILGLQESGIAKVDDAAVAAFQGQDHVMNGGYSVALGGDYDGDGFDDMVLGARGSAEDLGGAWLFFGGAPR